jgi:hypothetical protein
MSLKKRLFQSFGPQSSELFFYNRDSLSLKQSIEQLASCSKYDSDCLGLICIASFFCVGGGKPEVKAVSRNCSCFV